MATDKAFWVEFFPINPATGTTVRVRMTTLNTPAATGIDLGNGEWMPYMTSFPDTEISVFDGVFDGVSEATVSGVEASDTNGFGLLFPSYIWDGTSVVVYKGSESTTTLGALTKIFSGSVTETPSNEEGEIKWSIRDKLYLFDVEAFKTTYAGTTGYEGTAEMKGVSKPFAIGEVLNLEPFLVDPAYLIYQYHGYGRTIGVQGLYENGLGFGAGKPPVAWAGSVAATYAALKAVTLIAGEWVDAPSIGMFRLGGEPLQGGVITCDVKGQEKSAGVLCERIDDVLALLVAQEATLAGMVDGSTYSGVYTGSNNQTIGDYFTGPINIGEVMARYLGQCGAYYFVSSAGLLRFGFVRMGTPALEIRSDGTTLPVPESVSSAPVSAPYKRMRMGADKVFRVHSLDEISDALYQAVHQLQIELTAITEDFYLAVDDDNLTIQEKIQIAIPTNTQYGNQYTELRARAIALGLSVTAIDAAYTAYTTDRNAISPAWNDTTQNSTRIPATFRANVAALGSALVALSVDISEEDAKRANWGTVGSRPTELTDGRIPIGIRAGGSLQGTIWGGANTIQLAELLETGLLGKSLSYDPDWSKGVLPSNIGTYDNSGGNKVTASLINDGTAPNGSGKVLRVSYDGTGTPNVNPSPQFGGIVQLLSSAGPTGISRPGFYHQGTRVAMIISAKVPVGRTIEHSSNTTGAEGGWTWITDNAGTGQYQTYIGIRTIGTTGSFSTTGHLFVSGGANVAFTWDIARYEQRELASASLPQLNRLIDAVGNMRADNELITLQGTSASIIGQGYMATQNYADWATRVTGTGKPSDNAGTSINMYDFLGSQYNIVGNTITKTGSSAWTSCCYSYELFKGACVLSGIISNPISGGGSMFGLADTRNAGHYSQLDYAFYRTSSTTVEVYESGVFRGSFACTASSRFSISYNGSIVEYYADTTKIYSTATTAGRTFAAGVCGYGTGVSVSQLQFGGYYSVADTTTSVVPLTPFGLFSEVIGNQVRKRGGTHGEYEGGAYGTPQKGTAFISARPIVNNTWITFIALDPTSATNTNINAAGLWYAKFVASTTGGGALYIIKGGTTVNSWGVGNVTPTDRFALVFNGRRVFAMLNGLVYGGNTSAYDVAPGTVFTPKVWDYYNSGDAGSWVEDVRYGPWSDARVYLDDGYTVLNQAGFRTIEGVAASVTGQGPGATAPGTDVLNYVEAVGGGNNMTIVRQPNNGFVSREGTVTGCLKIALPNGYTNTMIRFAIDLFDYASNRSVTYLISGYAYPATSATNGHWVNISAQYIGPETASKRVRFGFDGTKACIWIGETTSTWDYPKVFLRDLIVGYGSILAVDWKNGWALTFSTTAPSNSPGTYPVFEVSKPRAGDAVMGESIFESAAGATATLANFKTALGVAASIAGQGALATKNNVDLSTTQVLPRGSIPASLANNGFSYTSTTTTITISWPTITVYRSDGSTISVASGSQAVTGLSSGTTYRIYPHLTDTGGSSASMEFITGVSPAFGSPAILYSNSSPNVVAAAEMYFYSRIPMGNFSASTTTSGTGGGGGGGWGCLHKDMVVGGKPARDLEPGDVILTPDGPATVLEVQHHVASEWYELYSNDVMVGKFTKRHLLYHAKSGEAVAAMDVRLGDILKAIDQHYEITGLRLCNDTDKAVGILIDYPHVHFAGESGIMCHNGTAKP